MSDHQGDDMTAIPDLRDVLIHAMTNTPRSLQVALGPSEIGTGCDRCLTHMLAGHDKHESGVPWLPTIGTAVHEWIEAAILRHLAETGSHRYLPEIAVNVGQLRGNDITGHSDVYDVETGTVIDFKVVGKGSIDSARKAPKATYLNQIQLYGKGVASLGFDVQQVAIWYLPRNAMHIDSGHAHVEPYDPGVAEQALARANAIASGIDSLGVDAVLEQMPPHTGDEFACQKWATDPSTGTPAEVTPDAFLGVA